MTTESYLWKKLKKMPDSDWERHEDKIKLGIPDTSFGMEIRGVLTNGWIELKAFKNWPKRGGNVKFHNFQSTQKRWLKRRGKAGGHCYLMAIVGRGKTMEVLMWHHRDLDQLGTLNQQGLIDLSIYYSIGSIPWRRLRLAIKRNP